MTDLTPHQLELSIPEPTLPDDLEAEFVPEEPETRPYPSELTAPLEAAMAHVANPWIVYGVTEARARLLCPTPLPGKHPGLAKYQGAAWASVECFVSGHHLYLRPEYPGFHTGRLGHPPYTPATQLRFKLPATPGALATYLQQKVLPGTLRYSQCCALQYFQYIAAHRRAHRIARAICRSLPAATLALSGSQYTITGPGHRFIGASHLSGTLELHVAPTPTPEVLTALATIGAQLAALGSIPIPYALQHREYNHPPHGMK